MNVYLLDTDIVSYLWDTQSIHHEKIAARLCTLNDDDVVAVSVITIYELTHAVESFDDPILGKKFENALMALMNDPDANIYPLDTGGALFFSRLKRKYKEKTGIRSREAKKNDLDLVIASIAMDQDATLISNDAIFKTFSQIESDFKWENWTD